MKMIKYFFLILAIIHLTNTNAHAYLDPGTGSYILQCIIAGIFAGGLAIKTFWQRISFFFQNLFSKKTKDDSK